MNWIKLTRPDGKPVWVNLSVGFVMDVGEFWRTGDFSTRIRGATARHDDRDDGVIVVETPEEIMAMMPSGSVAGRHDKKRPYVPWVAELRAALFPFAADADHFDHAWSDEVRPAAGIALTVGDLRRARDVIGGRSTPASVAADRRWQDDFCQAVAILDHATEGRPYDNLEGIRLGWVRDFILRTCCRPTEPPTKVQP